MFFLILLILFVFAYFAYFVCCCIYCMFLHMLHNCTYLGFFFLYCIFGMVWPIVVHILPWLKLPVGRQDRNKSKQSKSAARTTSSRQRKISLEREEHDVVDAEEFLAVERTDKKGCVLTCSGRPSVKRNAVNGKYGTNYRKLSGTLL